MTLGDPAESKNFKLLGHDPSAAWGGDLPPQNRSMLNGSTFCILSV